MRNARLRPPRPDRGPGALPAPRRRRAIEVSVRARSEPPAGPSRRRASGAPSSRSGGVRENGDRYAPLYIGGNNPPDGSNGGPNPDYDPNGYEYSIEVGANGQVRLFDPVFCATGRNLSGGWFGTGDHWTTDGTGGGTTIGPVAVAVQALRHREHALHHDRRHPGRLDPHLRSRQRHARVTSRATSVVPAARPRTAAVAMRRTVPPSGPQPVGAPQRLERSRRRGPIGSTSTPTWA